MLEDKDAAGRRSRSMGPMHMVIENQVVQVQTACARIALAACGIASLEADLKQPSLKIDF